MHCPPVNIGHADVQKSKPNVLTCDVAYRSERYYLAKENGQRNLSNVRVCSYSFFVSKELEQSNLKTPCLVNLFAFLLEIGASVGRPATVATCIYTTHRVCRCKWFPTIAFPIRLNIALILLPIYTCNAVEMLNGATCSSSVHSPSILFIHV